MQYDTAVRRFEKELAIAQKATSSAVAEKQAAETNKFRKAVRRARTALHVAVARGNMTVAQAQEVWAAFAEVPDPVLGTAPPLDGFLQDGSTFVRFEEGAQS